MISDAAPDLGVEADFIRYYVQKKTGDLNVSKKNPIYHAIVPNKELYTCRETLSHRIKDSLIERGMPNPKSSKQYQLRPLVAKMIGKNLLLGNGTIIMVTNNTQLSNFFLSNKAHRYDVIRALNYIVAIMGVCMFDEKEERLRRTKVGTPDDYSIRQLSYGIRFTYRVLSPAFCVSPVLLSLYTLLSRNAMACVYRSSSRDVIKSMVFDAISENEINDIIVSSDRKRALRVFNKIIVPFFKSSSIRDSSGIVLSNSTYRRVIQKFINGKSKKYFNPSNTNKYWNSHDDHYGFYDYCDEH